MSDDNKSSEEKVRHTVSMTHRQLGLSASGISILTYALVGPLGHFFQSKAEGAAQGEKQTMQAEQIVEIKKAMNDNKNEIIDKINDVVRPLAKDIDRHETRIVNLEFIQMKPTKGK